jgi:hypothetical protein
MQGEVKGNSDDIREVKSKVEIIDNKSKFDFLTWVRDRCVPYLLVGGLVYLLVIGGG